MSDVNANIGVQIDTSQALAELKSLQRQLAVFYSSISKSSAAAVNAQRNLQLNLLSNINASGKFATSIGSIRTSTESFTHALEKNKLSMREYFRYAGASTKTFGRLFKSEFDTIGKVADERVKKMQTQYIKMGRDANGVMKAMAITPLSLNMNDYATKTAIAAQKQALFNQLLKQGSTNLLNFGKNTQWAGRQLMVGFTIPLTYLGTAAAKTFMDLEAQAIKFKRVYGDMFTTTEQTNQALANIQNLAKEFTKYGVSVSQTMEMAASAAAMGKTGADLTAQVAEATRLAVLGGVEQAQALETTISVTNAFGVASEDLAKKINFLNAVENQTVVSIEDLTVAIPKAGPVVKQLGGDVEDLAFFLTAMKEGGINASEGANALKSGLAALINPTKKASEMLGGMGINIKGIVEANKGDLKGTVVGFAQALDTLAPLDRARAIEQLFGKFQFARLSTLFQNITKDGTQAARVLKLASASVEELAILSERELKTVEDAIGTNFREAVEKLKVAIAPIGKVFLQAVTPIANAIVKVADKFNSLGDGTKKFIVIMTTITGIIGPALLMTFGLLANASANIIKLFAAMRGGFLRFGSTSKVLGQQTQYLNMEQLEAQTVATSLNQAHAKLTQQFVMETGAVQALRKAYLDATLAAASFAAANPGMMVPGKSVRAPRKFADGTAYVPGTGNKDSVPSLLMPGEAVIPKKVAQDPRFQPIIDAMVSGKIQAYEDGTVFAHAVDKRVVRGSAVPANMQALGFGAANAYTAIGFDISAEANKRLINGQMPLAKYIEEINSPMATRTMMARLLDSGVLPGDATKITDQMRSNLIKSFAGMQPNALIGDRDVYSRMGNARTGIIGGLIKDGRGGRLSSAMRSLYAPASFSPLGASAIKFNSEASVSDVIRAVQGTRTSQSAIAPLRRLQELDPTYRLRVTRDALGNVIGYERPEISSRTGQITSTRSVGVLSGDRFLTGRIGRGGGRQIRASKASIQQATELLTSRSGQPIPPSAQVVGGKVNDTRMVAKAPGEITISRSSANALRSGKGINIPRFGRIALAGYGDGDPAGQTTSRGGMSYAQMLAAQNKISLNEAKKLIAQQKRQLNLGTEEIKNKTQAAQQEKELAKQRTQLIREQRAQRVGRVAGPIAGLAGIGTMAGFATGNMQLGTAMMGISAIATIAPMLTNPIGATVAAATALAGGVLLLNKRFNDATKKNVELVNSLSATSAKMKEVGQLTGKVGAVELAAKQRETGRRVNEFRTGYERGGNQFGTNFLESEVGKKIYDGFINNFKNNSDQAAKQLAVQLSSYISDGILSAEQSNSIARSIGIKLGDMSLTANINAELRSLVGPNGEDILKDPLQVRIKIINANEEFNKIVERDLKEKGGATGKGGGELPAIVATQNARALELAQAQRDAQYKTNQEIIDTLTKQKALTTDKAKQAAIEAEIQAAKAKQKADDQVLAKASLQAIKDAERLYNLSREANAGLPGQLGSQMASGKFVDALQSDIKNKFKDNPLLNYFIDKSASLKTTQLEVQIDTLVSGGNLSLPAAISLMDMLGGSKESEVKLKTILETTLINQDPGVVQTLLNITGGMDKKIGTKLFIDITSPEGKDKFEDRVNALNRLQDVAGKEINLDILFKNNSVDMLDKLVVSLKAVEGIKGPITPKVIANIQTITNDPTIPNMDGLLAVWDKYDALPDERKKTIIQEYIALYRSITPEEAQDFLKNEIAAGTAGMSPISKESVSNSIMAKYTDKSGKINVGAIAAKLISDTGAKASDIKTPAGGGTETGQRDTTLDDLLTRLKRVRDASINAQGGLNELRRVFKSSNGDITIFKGLDQQLAKLGAGSEFINFVGGLDNAIRQKFITIKKGVTSLTEDGKKALKMYNEVVLGDFQNANVQAINGLAAQKSKFVELRQAGVSAKDALALVTNEQIALALASGKSKEEIDAMITSIQSLRAAELDTLKTINPEEYWNKQKGLAMEYFDVQERISQKKYRDTIKQQEKEIDAIQALIRAEEDKSSKISHDLSIMDHEAEKINEKYQERQDALQVISNLNRQLLVQEKDRLNIADAITSGDISAAAQAIQDARANASQSAIDNQQKILDAQKQLEIDNLRNAAGLTRKQLEEQQWTITQTIYTLEQDRLIPAQKNLEITQAKLQAELDAIDAQKIKWEDAQLAIDTAKVKTDDYNTALATGLSLVSQIVALMASATWGTGGVGGPGGGTEGTNGTGTNTTTNTTSTSTTGSTVTVKSGNTLSGIAKAAGVSLSSVIKANPQIQNPSLIKPGQKINIPGKMYGGLINTYNDGGSVSGNGMTDSVLAMLTPGEFVMNRSATQKFLPMLSQMNESLYPSSFGTDISPSLNTINASSTNIDRTVYNYNLSVTTNANNVSSEDIARTVVAQIKRVDAQRIRSNK